MVLSDDTARRAGILLAVFAGAFHPSVPADAEPAVAPEPALKLAASSEFADPGPAPEPAPMTVDPRERKIARERDLAVLAANPLCRVDSSASRNLVGALSACDNRFRLPDYGDFFWPPRTVLLHNRALVLFQMHQTDRAFEALDQADAIAAQSSDSFWKWSGGVNGNLLRAVEAIGAGQAARARGLLESVSGLRPFAPSFYPGIDFVDSMLERDPARLASRLEGRTKYDPNAYRILIYLNMLIGRNDQALRAASQYSIVKPLLRHGWKFENPAVEVEQARENLNMLCVSAYVAALEGKASDKDAYLHLAQSVVDRYHEPNPAMPVSDKERKFRAQTGTVLVSALAAWEGALQLRQDLGDKSVAAIRADFAASSSRQDVLPAFIEMIATRGRAAKADAEQARQIVDNFVTKGFFADTRGGITGLQKLLPAIENTFSISKFDNNTNDWLVGTYAGYSQRREEGTAADIRTVHYETGEGTTILAEELLMLAIANYARKDGYDGFVILSRRTIGRETNIAFNGPVQFVGYDAQARVMMIRGGVIPQGRNILPGRIIGVAEVEQALGPRFSAYAASKAAKEAADKAAKKASK